MRMFTFPVAALAIAVLATTPALAQTPAPGNAAVKHQTCERLVRGGTATYHFYAPGQACTIPYVMAPGAGGAVDTAPVSVDIDDTDIANVSPNAGVSRARRGGEGTSFTFTAGTKAGTAKATMTIAGEPFSIVIINAGP